METTIREFRQFFELTGHGAPLLCLPAFPFTHELYQEQRELADIARLIQPDYRGTGLSAYTSGPYTMDLLAEDMFGLLDHLGIEQAVVLGVSLGGYVAMAMTALRPGRIQGLILSDTRAEADPPIAAERRRHLAEVLKRDGTEVLTERVLDMLSIQTRREQPDLPGRLLKWVRDQSGAGLAELARGMAERPDRQAWLAQIEVPTLVLCGNEDTITPAADMRLLAEAVPAAEFQLIPWAGHLSPLERPRDFNQHVRQFLQRLAPDA